MVEIYTALQDYRKIPAGFFYRAGPAFLQEKIAPGTSLGQTDFIDAVAGYAPKMQATEPKQLKFGNRKITTHHLTSDDQSQTIIITAAASNAAAIKNLESLTRSDIENDNLLPDTFTINTRKKGDRYVTVIDINEPLTARNFGRDIFDKYEALRRNNNTTREKVRELLKMLRDKSEAVQHTGQRLYKPLEEYATWDREISDADYNDFCNLFLNAYNGGGRPETWGDDDPNQLPCFLHHRSRASNSHQHIIFEHDNPIEWPKEYPPMEFIQDIRDAVADEQTRSWLAPPSMYRTMFEVTQPKQFSFKNWPEVEKQISQTGKTTVLTAQPASSPPAPPVPHAVNVPPVSTGLKNQLAQRIDWNHHWMHLVLLDEPIEVRVNTKNRKKINFAEVPWHKTCYVCRHQYSATTPFELQLQRDNSAASMNLSLNSDHRGFWYFGRDGDVNPALPIDDGKKYEKYSYFPVMEMEAAMRMGFPRGFEQKFETMRKNHTKYQWSPRMKSLIDAGLFDYSYDAIKSCIYQMAPQQQIQGHVQKALKSDTAQNYLKPAVQTESKALPSTAASLAPPSSVKQPHNSTPQKAGSSTPKKDHSSENGTGYGNAIKATGGAALLAGGIYLASQEQKNEKVPANQNDPHKQEDKPPQKKGLSFASISMIVVGAILAGWAAVVWHQRANGLDKGNSQIKS